MPKGARKAVQKAVQSPPKASALAEPQDAGPEKPERLTKAQLEAERFPKLEKYPALRRALVLYRAMESGKTREEAEMLAEEKVGPRSPRSKPMKRGKRPEAPKRQRVKPRAPSPKMPGK